MVRTVVPGAWLGLLAALLFLACQQGPGTEGGGSIAAVPGEQLYQRLACHGCHSRRGQGGTLGPALDCLGQRLARDDVERQLLAPRPRPGRARMPSFAFITDPERQALLAFLLSRDDCPASGPKPGEGIN
jgi:mono/diheme cytochrome c family protein